jgi:hypothetical protein
MTPLTYERVDNLANWVGAPATREEERSMAIELRDLRRVARVARRLVDSTGDDELVELRGMLDMAAETSEDCRTTQQPSEDKGKR